MYCIHLPFVALIVEPSRNGKSPTVSFQMKTKLSPLRNSSRLDNKFR